MQTLIFIYEFIILKCRGPIQEIFKKTRGVFLQAANSGNPLFFLSIISTFYGEIRLLTSQGLWLLFLGDSQATFYLENSPGLGRDHFFVPNSENAGVVFVDIVHDEKIPWGPSGNQLWLHGS